MRAILFKRKQGFSRSLALTLLSLVSIVLISSGQAWANQTPLYENQELLEALTVRSAQLRSVGIIDSEKIIDLFAHADNRFTFKLDIGDDKPINLEKTLWSYFFRTSQVYFSNINSERPLVAFYSVLADAWWISQWHYQDEKLGFSQAYMSLGKASKGKLNSILADMPPWFSSEADESFIDSIHHTTKQSTDDFLLNHPAGSVNSSFTLPGNAEQVANKQTIANRLAILLLGLSELEENTPANSFIKSVYQDLEMGNLPGLKNAMPPSAAKQHLPELVRLPAPLRASLTPVFSIQTQDTTWVLAAAPTQARYFVLTQTSHVQTQGSLEKIGAFDVFPRRAP